MSVAEKMRMIIWDVWLEFGCEINIIYIRASVGITSIVGGNERELFVMMVWT